MSQRTPNTPTDKPEIQDKGRRIFVAGGGATLILTLVGCREKVKTTGKPVLKGFKGPDEEKLPVKKQEECEKCECDKKVASVSTEDEEAKAVKEVEKAASAEKTEKPKETKEVIKTSVMINGKEVAIKDVQMLNKDSVFIDHARIMQYPMSDEARNAIKQMGTNEDFAKVEDYPKNDPFVARETAAKLYALAKQYAAAEGYKLAAFSAHRTYAKQRELEEKNKNRSEMDIATVEDSQFVRGGALSVLLFKKGNKNPLTPTRAKPNRGTKEDIHRLYKYMQLAGFVNFNGKPEHHEIGSEEWAKIMVQAGIPEAKSKIYQAVDKPTLKTAK